MKKNFELDEKIFYHSLKKILIKNHNFDEIWSTSQNGPKTDNFTKEKTLESDPTQNPVF